MSLRRFWKYCNKVYGLEKQIGYLKDNRMYPVISTRQVWLSVFFLFILRFRSLNDWEQESRQRPVWQEWLGGESPSADTVGYVFSRFKCSGLREGLFRINEQLKRNKVLESGKIRGLLVAAIDGHELMSSFHRCCPKCLKRKIKTDHGEKTQYYHKIVVCQVVGDTISPLLDMEMQKPGEDEVAAALRLLKRICKKYPRYFDVVVMDALYARQNVVEAALSYKKDVVIVLKDERRDLYQDAKGLFKHSEYQTGKQNNVSYQLWDSEHFTSWTSIKREMRVVRSLEHEIVRQRIGGQWKDVIQEHDWYWVTTLPKSYVDAEGIRQMGHARWTIENQGFNELANHWNMDRCWKHHPVAIEAFVLTLFWAYMLFHAFTSLNIKPEIRKLFSMLSISRLFYASLSSSDCSIPALIQGTG